MMPRRSPSASAIARPMAMPVSSTVWWSSMWRSPFASIVMSIYHRLRAAGFGGGEALLGAYSRYAGVCQAPHRISFDRAFDLAAHTDGLWLTETRSFSLVVCPACHSEFLAAFGSVALSNDDCPFCKLVQRYRTDSRVQSSFPAQPLANPSAMQLGMLILLRGSSLESPTHPHY